MSVVARVTIASIETKLLALMTNFTLPLDIETLEIIGQHVDSKGNIIFDVVSTCTETTCPKCGKPATKP